MNQINKYVELILPWLLDHGLKIILITISAFVLHIVLKKVIAKTIRATVTHKNNEPQTSEIQREDTLIRIFFGISKVSIITIAVLMVFSEMGLMIGPVLAGAGIVGLAVGFGGQYLIRDIIGGLFIILENQYRVGDSVDFDGTSGTVEDISVRMTTLRDLNGTIHHVPHGEIKKVSNLSKEFSRVNMDIGIAYNSDIEKVIRVVNQTGLDLANDPVWIDAIITAPYFLRINEFADSAIMIKIIGDTQPIKQWEVSGELRKRLKIAFDKNGIEFPFPQMVLHKAKD